MKLTRTVHAGDVQVFVGSTVELLPDVRPIGGDELPLERCLLFVDAASGDAYAFLFTPEQVRVIGERILDGEPSRLEVVRTIPGELL